MIKPNYTSKAQPKNAVEPLDPQDSLLFYDFETFSLDTRTGKAAQFAAIRTDMDLNIIGDSTMIYCSPSEDFLPSPMACAVTGISPATAAEKGISEAVFIAEINKTMSEPSTCTLGFNSIRFDDELTRHLLYRNFMGPYDREWQNNNSRWDIINVARACRALRPEAINWPVDESGKSVLKLDQLTKANGIEHSGAHDALGDVMATIELTRLIKKAQPKLFDLMLKNRTKKATESIVNTEERKKQPLIYIASYFENDIAILYPVAQHPDNKNSRIFVNLLSDKKDIDAVISLIKAGDSQTINDLIFKKKGEDVKRVPVLVEVKMNQSPALLPFAGLRDSDAAKFNIDKKACLDNIDSLTFSMANRLTIGEVFNYRNESTETDPEKQLYTGGFFSKSDAAEIERVHSSTSIELTNRSFTFDDERLDELLMRYKGRNFPEALSMAEESKWVAYCDGRIRSEEKGFFEDLKDLSQSGVISPEISKELYSYGYKMISEHTEQSFEHMDQQAESSESPGLR